jgi:TolB protein
MQTCNEMEYALHRLASDPSGGGDAAISPDGTKFVTSSNRTGDTELWLFDLAKRQWAQLTWEPGSDFEGQWSPDGKRIAFTSTRGGQKDIWVLSVDEAIAAGKDSALRLTSSASDEEYPSWSPDGSSIVFTGGPWRRQHFRLVPAAGGEVRNASREAGHAGACTYAPDGSSLVCHRYDSGTGDIVRISLVDGSEVSVTTGLAWDYKPSTSPDGKWIALSRSYEGSSNIWLIPATGVPGRPLIVSSHDDRWPSWSASGERLLFHRVVEQGKAIRMLDSQTGALETLVGPDEQPLQASLHPMGRLLAYCAQQGTRRVIRVLDLQSGERRDLRSKRAGDACFPRWSPDGARIAFGLNDTGRWEVATVDASGDNERVLTRGEIGLHGMDGPLGWSPDGKRIVFQADTKPFESDLYIVDVETRSLRNLTQDRWFDESPSWSPDGRSILYMSTRGDNWTWGLFRWSLVDGTIESVAKPSYVEKNFPIQGSSGRLYWSWRDGAGDQHLAVRGLDGKLNEHLVADVHARWPSESGDGKALIYTVLDQTVEYWVVEHPFGRGSPLFEAQPVEAITKTGPSSSKPVYPVSAGLNLQRSPVDFHRR